LLNFLFWVSIQGDGVENTSIDSYLKSNHKADDLKKDKHCIIMDEVDGMSGNEDRGGITELINTIKHSKIPIICICNDRQHIKIRSLANYCFDLRFYKPRIEQIRAPLMSICFKEGIKATPDLLDQIIIGCNYDIRQCLHNLSMWSSNNKNLSLTSKTQTDIEKAMKDVRMNPFEACKQVFQIEPTGGSKAPRTFHDKLDLFFTDYSLMPLLIQENYLSVHPASLKGTQKQKEKQHLELLSATVESLLECDRIGKLLRTNNNW
jgi:replication factor C subunit 1